MSARNWLLEYALGELDPARAREVERLLARDAGAREEVRVLRDRLVNLVEENAPVPPRPQVLARVLARVAGKRRPPLGWMVAASLSALIAGAGVGWGAREARANAALEAEQRQLSGWLAQPDVRVLALRTRDRSLRGRVLLLPGGRALFVLPDRPPPGKVYQTWAARNWKFGQPLTALKLSDSNVIEVSYTDQDYLCVTLEPGGGSPQPTQWVGGVFF